MRKDRNTFFSEAQMSSQSSFPNPGMNMPVANAPYQAASASQSFYAGPGPMNGAYNYDYNTNNEIEGRLAKLERQLNRIENRLAKLESQNMYTNDDYEINNSSNMYMV